MSLDEGFEGGACYFMKVQLMLSSPQTTSKAKSLDTLFVLSERFELNHDYCIYRWACGELMHSC